MKHKPDDPWLIQKLFQFEFKVVILFEFFVVSMRMCDISMSQMSLTLMKFSEIKPWNIYLLEKISVMWFLSQTLIAQSYSMTNTSPAYNQ